MLLNIPQKLPIIFVTDGRVRARFDTLGPMAT